MRSRIAAAGIATCLLSAGAIAANVQTLAISLGIRETATSAPIGANGGRIGPLEWVNLDAQSLPLDGDWHQFQFHFQSDPLTGFTGNGTYDGTRGTLEHVRILNSGGVTQPMRLWLDAFVNTTATGAHSISDFEGFANGTEIMFRAPSVAGTTSAFLVPGGTSLSTDTTAFQGAFCDEINLQFLNDSPIAWVRLTTFDAANVANPAIEFENGDLLTFAMKGIIAPEPGKQWLLAAASLWTCRRVRTRRRNAFRQASA